eukprot:TRINITY_DN58218_c1_g1_i1.p1 TRINITY_DN58218_c1_g1~~TRINITY_DN58218_c1_g1_i1.p1  ORF type:complete len:366 (-),score=29.50 TRINITY_DN58218_c1_g1_i1:255-1352(-)
MRFHQNLRYREQTPSKQDNKGCKNVASTFSFKTLQRIFSSGGQRGEIQRVEIRERRGGGEEEEEGEEEIFDIEECDTREEVVSTCDVENAIKSIISNCGSFTHVIREIVQEHREERHKSICTPQCLRSVLENRGYVTRHITNQGGGPDLWKRLEHDFVLVTGCEQDSTPIIVDTEFQNQFQIAKPSQEYKRVFDTIPPVFIGTQQDLSEIVKIVVRAMQASFRENGLNTPPWRSFLSLQSKWSVSQMPKWSDQLNQNSQIVINKTWCEMDDRNSNRIGNYFKKSWNNSGSELEIRVQSVNSLTGTSASSELSALLRENSRTNVFDRTIDVCDCNNNGSIINNIYVNSRNVRENQQRNCNSAMFQQ